MRKQIYALLLLLPLLAGGQSSFTVSGRLGGWGGKVVYLLSYFGEKNRLADSARCDTTGRFSFSIPPATLASMFRVTWGKDKWIDLIYNRENVWFTTPADLPPDSLRFTGSVENRIYYTCMGSDQITQAKMDLLQPVLDMYPERDSFYAEASAEYESIQRKQEALLDSLVKLFPDSYALKICKVYETPYIPAALPAEMRVAYLRQHYLDNVDFTDTALLRSNAFPNKAISYLSLYSNNRLDQKALEAEFIRAVTVLMSAAAVSPEVYKYLLDYLVGGFDKYHFEDVITYMAENFKDPFSCEDQDQKSALQKKLDTFKKISTGSVAPPLEAPDAKGVPVKVADIKSPYTLLLFYSSECSHCVEMIPRVKALYDSQKPKKMEVVAYSLDTSKEAWVKFIKSEKLDWINISELKGFDSKATDDFNIYATPTMFLLDKDKKILAKPISYRELEQVLKENGLM
jgi:peroxiredoxin